MSPVPTKIEEEKNIANQVHQLINSSLGKYQTEIKEKEQTP
jgi:hypothetical protein